MSRTCVSKLNQKFCLQIKNINFYEETKTKNNFDNSLLLSVTNDRGQSENNRNVQQTNEKRLQYTIRLLCKNEVLSSAMAVRISTKRISFHIHCAFTLPNGCLEMQMKPNGSLHFKAHSDEMIKSQIT